jgi:hypothetical protein
MVFMPQTVQDTVLGAGHTANAKNALIKLFLVDSGHPLNNSTGNWKQVIPPQLTLSEMFDGRPLHAK